MGGGGGGREEGFNLNVGTQRLLNTVLTARGVTQ